MAEATGKAVLRKHKPRPFTGAWFKRLPKRTIMSILERVDFRKKFLKIGDLEQNRPYRERMTHAPNIWINHDQMKERAVELTAADAAQRGIEVDHEHIVELVEGLASWYDHEFYLQGGVTVPVATNHLFEQHDPMAPFVSPDKRELAHLDLLNSYREQGLGVVYLANHSSHLDEFLVDGMLALLNMGLPLFAAGANMMAIKSFAKILMVGSYVVQRRGGDKLYLSALSNYCQAVSELGGQQGIFLEAWLGGARSRDGSLRYPRRLVTLRGALAGEKDVVVQPVAISYSMVPEDLPLAERASGLSWVRGMNPFTAFLRMLKGPGKGLWQSMENIYGRAYVTLPKPMLLSELRQTHEADPAGMGLDEFVALSAIKEIARTKKVMASQLVARGLVRARRLKSPDLTEAVECELKELRDYHRSTFGQEPDLEDFLVDNSTERIIEDGLKTLRRRAVLTRWSKDLIGLPRVRSESGLGFYATHGDRRLYSPTAKENIVVVGAGDWGFAFASLVGNRILEDKRYLNASLTLYDSRPEVAMEMGIHRSPPGRFKEHRLPKNVFVTSDAPTAFRKASEVFMAVTPKVFGEVAEQVINNSEGNLRFIVATIGFEPETNRLPVQVMRDLAAKYPQRAIEIYTLAGPVKEADLVLQREALGVLACPPGVGNHVPSLLHMPPVDVVTSDDPVGVQLCGSMARVYTLWGGFLQRVGRLKGSAQLGHYIARVSAEASRLAVALGGKASTFTAESHAWTATLIYHGLSGPSLESGRKLGALARRKKDLPAEAAKMQSQSEEADGIALAAFQDLKASYQVAKQKGLDLPILSDAYETIWEGKQIEEE